ncbi:MAG: AAA family ATPase [Brasilonema angustatum HA4187-MV1]|jgi:WD40 repeat protein|nr:AAA family ATPase [Brasilonema angustatum HA4187-MV1]
MSDSGLRDENRSIRIEKDAISSAIISGDGNRVVIYQYQLEHQLKEEKVSTTAEIGRNPYKGLLAFYEVDSERYFGREKQIEKLWNLFRTLHENTTQSETPLRLLPILGPSGSGKSSLARAGLIPELARRPLPGKSQARVVVLVPGTHPIEALATVLARVATNDQTPVTKTREFAEELKQTSSNTTNTIIYDGLRRIANVLPEIAISPLMVLIDQFEEVYSLCDDPNERQIFIENLIHAASDRSGCVSVIITLRSDFLGETQRHPTLNQVIAKLGVIVPAMSTEELQQAITKPASNAGHPLDEAVVSLLLKDTEGREGALPLLQFALTRIWDGLKIGVEPVKTLKQIGGVGGALADEAQRIYQSLNEQEKKIAQRVFIGLVQLGEGTSDTRRRANIDSLISYKDEPESVRKVINRFASPGVRLVTLFSIDGIQTAEVTHEALFTNWGQMKKWLDSSRSDIRFQRRLDETARVWNENNRPEGSLWRPPDLNFLKKYYERASDNMTPLQVKFFRTCENAARKAEQERKRQRQFLIGILSTALVLTTTIAGVALHEWQNAEIGRIQQTAISAKSLLPIAPLESLVTAISVVGQSRSPLFSFPNQSLPPSVQDSLFSAVQNSREKNIFRSHQGLIWSVAISTKKQRIVSGGDDGTVRLWDRKGKQLGTFRGHHDLIWSVAISIDGETIVSGGRDGTVRLWDSKGEQVGTFRGHQGDVLLVAISIDSKTIVSGGRDGTVRLWDRKGKQVGTFRGHQGDVTSVAISIDGKTIVSGGRDGTVRLWDSKGKQVGTFRGHQGEVRSVAISTDSKTIVSGGEDGTVRLWDRKGKQVGTFRGHQGEVWPVAISIDGKTIVSGGRDGTVRLWDSKGKQLATLIGHQGTVLSIAISTDGETIVSGGRDGTVRLWDSKSKQLAELKGHQGYLMYVAISTDGETLVSGGSNGTVKLWDSKGKQVGTLIGHQGRVMSIAISTDKQTIVSGGEDGTMRLWDSKGKQQVAELKGHQGEVKSVVISTDKQTIVSGGRDDTVRLWDSKGKQVATLIHHQNVVFSVAISTDKQRIVSGGYDGTVRLWDSKGKQVGTFRGHQGYVSSVAISTKKQTIVSGGEDGTVRLWDSKGKQVGTFRGHQGDVTYVAISTDEQTIVSGGADGTVRLWDSKGKQVATLIGHQSPVYSVAISTDKQTIVSGGLDGTVQLWDIRFESWLKAGCERLQDHPVFKELNISEAKGAKATCKPYLRNL